MLASRNSNLARRLAELENKFYHVCNDTLPWLILLTHDLPVSFALLFGKPFDVADSATVLDSR